jgi:chaperonin GroES
MAKVVPLNDYVLVKPIKDEPKTASGIITAPTSKEKPGKGEVLAVGEGKVNPEGKLIPIENVKVGDVVYFTKYSPEELEIDGEKLLLVRADSILAKEEK